jgi:hypothetical protein
MTVTVRANMKDENYFAPAASWTTGTRARSRAFAGRIWKRGDLRGYLMVKKAAPSPPLISDGRLQERLLLLAGESPLAQLTQRHIAAHRLAIGLA